MIKFRLRPKTKIIKTSHLNIDGAIYEFMCKIGYRFCMVTTCYGKEFSGQFYKEMREDKVLLYNVEIHKRNHRPDREYRFNYYIVDVGLLKMFCKSVIQEKRYFKLEYKHE